MRVTLDTLIGARVTITRQGKEIVRPALIEDVTGDAELALVQAASAPGLPALGSRHPAAADAVLDRIDVDRFDHSKGIVTAKLIYKTPNSNTVANLVEPAGGGGAFGGGEISVLSVELFSRTRSETTTEDWRGEPMRVPYQGVGLLFVPEEGTVLRYVELAEAEVLRPMMGVRVRHERPSFPKQLARDVIASTNKFRWSGYGPHTWACTDFSCNSEAGIYTCSFEALYNPKGWRHRHDIEIAGRLPADATRGNGIEIFNVQRPVNWAVLGFSI